MRLSALIAASASGKECTALPNPYDGGGLYQHKLGQPWTSRFSLSFGLSFPPPGQNKTLPGFVQIAFLPG
jgi:hypothetical protein